MVTISEIKPVKLKNPILIEGFPGVGLIGTIAASYLVEQLKMEEVGYVSSPKFPPMSTIHDYRPHYPARIYQHKGKNLLVLLSEFIVPLNIVHDLSHEVLRWAKTKKVKQIVSMSGVAFHGPANAAKIYGIATTDEMARLLKKNGVELIREGVTTGVSGVLMAECAATRFPAISVLAPTEKGLPDPRAAAKVVDMLNKIFKLGIDTAPLAKEADKVETRMSDLLQKIKESHAGYKTLEEHAPMYG